MNLKPNSKITENHQKFQNVESQQKVPIKKEKILPYFLLLRQNLFYVSKIFSKTCWYLSHCLEPEVKSLRSILLLENTFWSPWPRSQQVLENAQSYRLEDNTIFWFVKKENDQRKLNLNFGFQLMTFIWDRMKFRKNMRFLRNDLFFFLFFGNHLRSCVLGPWPRALLSLASRGSVLENSVLGFGFFLSPWPRTLGPRLHLCLR